MLNFEGTVLQVLEAVKGHGARGEWKKQEVIFEIPGEYPRKVCVAFWNQRADDASQLRIGEKVAVSANVESREFNGRWYTELRGWRMSKIQMEPVVGGYGGGQQGGYGQGGYQDGGYQPKESSSMADDNAADDLPF